MHTLTFSRKLCWALRYRKGGSRSSAGSMGNGDTGRAGGELEQTTSEGILPLLLGDDKAPMSSIR